MTDETHIVIPKRTFAIVFFVALMGGVVGGIIPTKRMVTETVVKRTIKHEVETVEQQEKQGCLNGEVGTLLQAESSHEGYGDKGDWQWMTLAVFQTKDGSVVTCRFYNGPVAKLWRKGDKMKVSTGEKVG